MSSDNILELCYNSNLLAGGSVYTEKVITGQYVSLNITVKSDVTLEIVTQFSGDGTYWDFNISNIIAPDTNKHITLPVQAKWIRLLITNSSASPSTFLRVYTYGTPTNSSVLAQLSKIGNLNPVVDIGNLPVNFATPTTLQRYKFTSGPTNPTTSPFYSLFPSLYLSHLGAAGSAYAYDNQVLSLIANNIPNTTDEILDIPMQSPTNTNIVVCTAAFTVTSDSTLGGSALVGVASNFGDRVAVGYLATSPFTAQGWGLYLTPAGTTTFIPRSDFNVDPCDGSVSLPTLDLTQLQSYQFVITPMGVDFYVRYQNAYSLVHRYSYISSTTPMFRDYSLGLFIRTTITAASVCTTGDVIASCSDWELQSTGRANVTLPTRSLCYECTKLAIPAAETAVFTLQNYTLFGAVSCIRTASVSKINLTRLSSLVPTTFRIYRNATILGAVYAYYSSYSNLRVDTAGTLSVAGTLLASLTLGPQDSSRLIDCNFELKQSDTLTVTAQSTSSSDVIISINIF